MKQKSLFEKTPSHLAAPKLVGRCPASSFPVSKTTFFSSHPIFKVFSKCFFCPVLKFHHAWSSVESSVQKKNRKFSPSDKIQISRHRFFYEAFLGTNEWSSMSFLPRNFLPVYD